jgi:transposase
MSNFGERSVKIEAVKLVTEEGMKASGVARDLGICQPALGSWIKDYQRSGQEAFPGKSKSVQPGGQDQTA